MTVRTLSSKELGMVDLAHRLIEERSRRTGIPAQRLLNQIAPPEEPDPAASLAESEKLAVVNELRRRLAIKDGGLNDASP